LIDPVTVADTAAYRGRFAPSPTGPLHAGSLVAALASFLDARHHGGTWRVRIDDIDPPREAPGSKAAILSALTAHGLAWDGDVEYQSSAAARYERALAALAEQELLFRCECTRTTLDARGNCGRHCRDAIIDDSRPHCLRVRATAMAVEGFTDRFLGPQPVNADTLPPDFIVRRRDGLFAYQLAAAVDDALPHFTHVVRGADLLDSSHRQRWLQRALGLASPDYAHVAVMCDAEGNKLSKQTGAPGLSPNRASENLRLSLAHLRQRPPPDSAKGVEDILEHAIAHWSAPSMATSVT